MFIWRRHGDPGVGVLWCGVEHVALTLGPATTEKRRVFIRKFLVYLKQLSSIYTMTVVNLPCETQVNNEMSVFYFPADIALQLFL